MKISATALVIGLTSLFASTIQVALATPLGLEYRTPSTSSNTHQLSKRSCGGTNYCSAGRKYPGCVEWAIGYQLCGMKYVEGGRNQQICLFCVEMNCNDTLCDELFGS